MIGAGLVDPVRVVDVVVQLSFQQPPITLIEVMRVVLGLNVLLLLSLGYVWAKNAWTFRSKHTVGMLTFAVLLLCENGLAFYLFVFHPVLSVWIATPSSVPPPAQYALLLITLLEFLGLVFLTWITWD